MRTTITTLLLFGILSLALAGCASIPDWYTSYSLPKEEHEIIGYGAGPDQETAKTRAFEAIATRIVVDVYSERGVDIRGRETARTGKIRTRVKARLLGVEPIRQEKIGGNWYVAVKYDDSTAFDKVVRAFEKGGCVDEFSDPLTEFSRRIEEKVQCIPAWYLEYDRQKLDWAIDVTTPENGHRKYSLRANELINYIPDKASRVLKVSASKQSVAENNDRFHLAIDNKRGGWLYLFNVTEEGQSVLMESFGRRGSRKGRRYPTRDTWCGYANAECLLTTKLPQEWDYPSAFEYYLAVLCPRDVDFHQPPIGMEVPDVDDPNTYSYGRLLREARRGNCDVAGSRIIVHREKK